MYTNFRRINYIFVGIQYTSAGMIAPQINYFSHKRFKTYKRTKALISLESSEAISKPKLLAKDDTYTKSIKYPSKRSQVYINS